MKFRNSADGGGMSSPSSASAIQLLREMSYKSSPSGTLLQEG